MQLSAAQYITPHQSAIHVAGGATGGQTAVDRLLGHLREFQNLEACLLASAQFDDADSVTVAVETSPDNSVWTVIGTFKQLRNLNAGVAAAFSLTTAGAGSDAGEAITLAAGAPAALLATPSQIRLALVDTTPSVTTGEVIVKGTGVDGFPLEESVFFTAAATKFTNEAFQAVSEIRARRFSVVGGAGDETLTAGYANTLKAHVASIALKNAPRYIRFNVTQSAGAGQTVTCIFNFFHANRLPVLQPYGVDFSWQE